MVDNYKKHAEVHTNKIGGVVVQLIPRQKKIVLLITPKVLAIQIINTLPVHNQMDFYFLTHVRLQKNTHPIRTNGLQMANEHFQGPALI